MVVYFYSVVFFVWRGKFFLGELWLFADGGYVPPNLNDLHIPAIFPWGNTDYGFSKQMLLVLISTVIVSMFFWLAGRKGALVPSKLQFLGELGYGFVRNSIAKESIGNENFLRFVPLLFSLFFFILVNNIYGIVPLLQLPSFSHPGAAYVLAIIVWCTFNVLGIKKHGFLGYIRFVTMPPNMPWPVYILLIPIEFLSTFIVRPITHSLRLFATMFAGHIVLMVFATGAEYLILEASGVVKVAGVFAFILGICMTFLEALIMVLQAYVFTLLTAMYIGGAIAKEH